MVEVWAAIPDYEGIYEASSEGRIRRIAHIPNARPAPYYLRELSHPGGYRMVALHKDKKQRHRLIHRLVMAAFHGHSKLEVNHLDGNKRNNGLLNLEYVTKQNGEHASRMKLSPRGERQGGSKLTESQVLEIRKLRSQGHTLQALADRFRVNNMNIHYIVTRKTWKHLP